MVVQARRPPTRAVALRLPPYLGRDRQPRSRSSPAHLRPQVLPALLGRHLVRLGEDSLLLLCRPVRVRASHPLLAHHPQPRRSRPARPSHPPPPQKHSPPQQLSSVDRLLPLRPLSHPPAYSPPSPLRTRLPPCFSARLAPLRRPHLRLFPFSQHFPSFHGPRLSTLLLAHPTRDRLSVSFGKRQRIV